MAIPVEFDTGNPRSDFLNWYSVTVGNLQSDSQKLYILLEYWINLTDAQKIGMKAQSVAVIDEGLLELADIKAHIEAL